MKELKLAFDTYASTLGGKLYGLHIYSYNETHKEREVLMIADSLTISTSTRGESVTHGLHASQLHVSLYSDSDRCYEWLASSNDREVYCELYTEGRLVWRGMLDGEQWHEPYSYRDGYATDLVFSDFGVLGRTRLSDACGERTVYSIKGFVQKCLDAIYPGNPGKLKVETQTQTRNALSSLGEIARLKEEPLTLAMSNGVLSATCRELVSGGCYDIKHPEYVGNICDSIIDLSHWHSDKDRPEDEPDVESVLEDVLKALNLHLWQTTRGDYVLSDHETLAEHYVYATLDAMGIDATIETTETYNRLTLTVDTDTDTSLGKPDMESVEGRDIHLTDLNDKVSDVTACTFTYNARLSKPISLGDGTDRSNYAYRTKSGSVSTDDEGVAVYVKPFTLLHFAKTRSGKEKYTNWEDWNKVKDFYPLGEIAYDAIWSEDFYLPQVDISTASEYFLALSLELLLDNRYNPYQRDEDMSSPYDHLDNFSINKKKYNKIRKHIKGVERLFLDAEVTCGDYKLVNSRFAGIGFEMMVGNEGDSFRFQTRWVPKSETDKRLMIPYAEVELGKWSKPVRNYKLTGASTLWRMEKEARASHNDTLTFPIPPVTNAPIRVSTSGRFRTLWGAMVGTITNGNAMVTFTNSDVKTPDLTKGKIPESDNTFVWRMSNLISYYLMRNLKLELVRRDEKEEKGEELVLASTLNEKAFEHRKEELALSSEPALPSISKALLRTLKEHEDKGWSKLWEQVSGRKLSPIVTLPPLRGKLTCGAFKGTLEELYIAEQYTHYAQRRNRISGSYAPINSITVLHEGKHFLVTQSDWQVLSDTMELTMEEIKPVNYSAKYIERTK